MSKIKKFTLPMVTATAAIFAYDIIFQEVKTRGSNKTNYEIIIINNPSTYMSFKETYKFKNWDKAKNEYPTLENLLENIRRDVNLYSGGYDEEIHYIQSIQGHEGLYDVKKTVYITDTSSSSFIAGSEEL
jgi:hypothetical protein